MEGDKAKHHIEIEKCKLSRYEIKANDSVDHSALFQKWEERRVRENRGCSRLQAVLSLSERGDDKIEAVLSNSIWNKR